MVLVVFLLHVLVVYLQFVLVLLRLKEMLLKPVQVLSSHSKFSNTYAMDEPMFSYGSLCHKKLI